MWLNSGKHELGRPDAQRDARVELHASGRIRLYLPELFSLSDLDRCREFLSRVFSVAEVVGVEILAAMGTADICISDSCDQRNAVAALARALSTRCNDNQRPPIERLWLEREPDVPLKVRRYGTELTTWQIAHELTGRSRLRHDLLLGNWEAALFFEQELAVIHGVKRVKGRPQTGSLLVEYDPAVLDRDSLLHVAEQLWRDFHTLRNRQFMAGAASSAAANGSLALAAAADFLVPMLMPASAAALVITHRRNIKTAVSDLAARRPSLPLLYTAIVAGTLVSGAFFAAAAMGWFMTFWDRQYHRRLAMAQRHLLRRFTGRSPEVRVCQPNGETRMPLERLCGGQVISIEAGELVGADGIITAGEGVVDERMVQGVVSPVDKLEGDWAYAGSRLLSGKLKVRVTRTGDGTRAATIAAMLDQASRPPAKSANLHGEEFARQAILPTFAVAGAGLVVGDLTTALAVLRPDYATGPGMALPLGVLEDLHRALDHGIIVRDAKLFQRLREVDLIVLDMHDELAVDANVPLPADHTPFAWTDSLRAGRDLSVALVSKASQRETERLGRRLGADFWRGRMTPAAKADLIERCAAAGHHVAYIGDCEANAVAASVAHVAVSTIDFSHDQQSAAAAFLMQPAGEQIGALWEIAAGRDRRNRVTYGWTLGPNLACVAGALLLDFSVFTAVLISNFGVLAAYCNVTSWLSSRSRAETKRIAVERSKAAIVQPLADCPGAQHGTAVEAFNRPLVTTAIK